jgi:hypothetical protein
MSSKMHPFSSVSPFQILLSTSRSWSKAADLLQVAVSANCVQGGSLVSRGLVSQFGSLVSVYRPSPRATATTIPLKKPQSCTAIAKQFNSINHSEKTQLTNRSKNNRCAFFTCSIEEPRMSYSDFVSALLVRVQRFRSGHADLKILSYIATVYQRLPPLPNCQYLTTWSVLGW